MATVSLLAGNVLARLNTLPNVSVYDSKVPSTPGGLYVVFYGNSGHSVSTSMAGTSDSLTWTFYVIVAGTLPAQVRSGVDRVRTALTGFRLDAAAWAGPLNEVDLQAPMLRDDSVENDVRFSQTLYFRLSTSRS